MLKARAAGPMRAESEGVSLSVLRKLAGASLRRADDGLRTRDLQLGKLALYQLSYVRARGYSNMREAALSPP